MNEKSVTLSRLQKILLLELSFLIYSIAAIFSKKAAMESFLSGKFILFVALLVIFLAIYAFLWQQVLRHFSLVTAMSNKGIVVIWTLLWSVLIFNETITIENIIGGALVIAGIVVVSRDES